jgi:enoyl-CoA hydratase/carnithine racemase
VGDLICETSERVRTLTLNRPERMNAISGAMLRELSTQLWQADRDPAVRCVILTGAGRGFCSGLDLKDVAGGQGDLVGADGAPAGGLDLANAPPVVLRRIDVPVICALNGPAAGYGMDLALGCDVVLASDQARFAPPVRRGVVPESGGTWLLPRLVGWHRACEISLLARPLDGARLLELGLVNRVVPHARLLDEARAWAAEIAANAPLAVAATKRSMRLGLDSSFDANMYHVTAELMQLLRTRDFREGLEAFMEKRDPRYEGR